MPRWTYLSTKVPMSRNGSFAQRLTDGARSTNVGLKPFNVQLALVIGERDRTLEQLEVEKWGRPPFPSNVVTTCHAMRCKPLRDLTDEELRLAIGQKMGLRFLMPLAV